MLFLDAQWDEKTLLLYLNPPGRSTDDVVDNSPDSAIRCL